MNDTIVAPSTPLQASAIGIVRLSGPDSHVFLQKVCPYLPESAKPRRIYLQWLREPDSNRAIDHAQMVIYQAPHSYTGEDMAEIFLHGAPVVMNHLLQVLQGLGARYARPGEFTERAVLNGRIDLLQAEGIGDLIDASTSQAAGQALDALAGKISRYVSGFQENILNLLSEIYAGIDFPDEDISTSNLILSLQNLLKTVRDELDGFRHNLVIKNGVKVVIAGAPNAGKSTLFNRLIGRQRTITAPLPGTTRDVISERLLWAGIPVILVDTGGIGKTGDVLNEEVQQVTAKAIGDADILLILKDGQAPMEMDLPVGEETTKITAINKSDLFQKFSGDTYDQDLLISAKTGKGIEELKDLLQQQAALVYGQATRKSSHIAGYRQFEVMTRITNRLQRSVQLLEAGEPEELAALDLEAAITDIGELTGSQVSENILDRIFSRFCIGK